MASQTSFGSNILFQNINDDLNASLATAEELSKEFNSMMKEASSSSSSNNNGTTFSSSLSSSSISRDKHPSSGSFSTSSTDNISDTSWTTTGGSGSQSRSSTSTSFSPVNSVMSGSKNVPRSPSYGYSSSPLSSPQIHRKMHSTLPRQSSDGFQYGQQSPILSPRRLNSSSGYSRSPQASLSYIDRSPSPNPSPVSMDTSLRSPSVQGPFLSPYNTRKGHNSPRPDRAVSPLSFNHPSATLPRNFGGFTPQDEHVQRQKSPNKWNETDLDMSYERKAHHTYDKSEWLRPAVASSTWRESNLDGPPPASSPKKDPRSNLSQHSHSSLPRNTRISIPPDVSSPSHSPYLAQPIISRISIPPSTTHTHQRRPIPLSVIMRLQNPYWGRMGATRHPRNKGGEGEPSMHQPVPTPREYFRQPVLHPPELRQPAIYSDALNPADVDAELERLDYSQHIPMILTKSGSLEGGSEVQPSVPRPLSPTRLQPVVAPEAQSDAIPDLEELLRIRSEIPRALKRRGSSDLPQPLKKASHYQPNQYKNLIDKLFTKKKHKQQGEQGSETSSSSDGEDCAMPPATLPASTTSILHDMKGYHSILRRSSHERKGSGKRARLSPLVLLLDGALVGELETVQRAVLEMNDPSQPNDEGITGLHNAVCGGHYNVVDFLVRIGANVSAPDSHGWTPLHCAASCNDRPLCEFLVRSGAAVMAMTESDGAVASQKCDPYASGFDECEKFLRGIEEAMGVDNSGVLYALWSYPAQASDELSFKEGDMVTILQKPEGAYWWWASLCGREGLVPNNYFGLFPKVRPKAIC